MKYSEELHDWVKSNNVLCEHAGVATVTYTTEVITALLDEIERLQNQAIDYVAVNAELVEKVERLQAERRWIPVSERLPEYGKAVLIMTTISVLPRIGRHYPTIPQWATTDLLYYHDISYSQVTHWMPIPKPPDAS